MMWQEVSADGVGRGAGAEGAAAPPKLPPFGSANRGVAYSREARSYVAFSNNDSTYLFIDFLCVAAFMATRRWISGSTRRTIVPL